MNSDIVNFYDIFDRTINKIRNQGCLRPIGITEFDLLLVLPKIIPIFQHQLVLEVV